MVILVLALIVVVVLSPELRKNGGEKKEEIRNDGSGIEQVPVQEKVVVPQDVYNLSGKILKIDGNTIIFNAEIYGVDEKGERTVRNEQRSAIVNAQTEINGLLFVNRSPVKEKLKFSDLKAGDYVDIVSDVYIGKLQEFLAKRITVKSS